MTAQEYVGGVWEARLLLQRGMAAIYLVAFLTVVNQFKPLLGERGLLPVGEFLEGVRFWDAPSLFNLGYSDRRLDFVACAGLVISALALLGVTEAGPVWVSVGAWLLLWVLYLSDNPIIPLGVIELSRGNTWHFYPAQPAIRVSANRSRELYSETPGPLCFSVLRCVSLRPLNSLTILSNG